MQGMNLSDIDLVKLLPLFMHEDEASNGLAAGVNQFSTDLIQYSPLLKKWDQIDYMDDRQLDEMAWELAVLWYDPAASIETKRRLIKNSDQVYSSLGTKWAVEEVVSSYLGDATVLEWWEYEGGRPHYFKVYSDNPRITTDLEAIFLRALDIVKRKSQWLEAITIELLSSGSAYAAPVFHDVSIETVRIVGAVSDMSLELTPSVGMSYHEVSTETHKLKGGDA